LTLPAAGCYTPDEENTPTQFMKNLIAIISLIILLIAELLLGNESQGPVMV
jgi:hypothetical protein